MDSSSWYDLVAQSVEHLTFNQVVAGSIPAQITTLQPIELRMDIPQKINLGSGKDLQPDYLNIDIDSHWGPDIVLNVSSPFFENGANEFITRRFGKVTLAPDSFNEILCKDVLEHVPDLIATMTNCLTLLKVGGVFNIIVPYDLSYGAWQDPTHIRAFNERSWLYYTDWFWYLSWSTHRFKMRSLDYLLNPVGEQMQNAGTAADLILRTPRAVDSMKLVLEKIVLDEEDHKALQTLKERRALSR